ncbi:VOC family protein [Fibrella aquatilis]|uniref:VOC family protein n=1 Tax=Fibrella aquatilis TaxID=2817059 RepID=A0A939G544_9BACT|nr:VOC family protein [Fibrella aquatilis]MBO0932284.1 VOC family protein [Fibrella aquatilis]
MTQISAYLHFNGNCREAMTFYQQCLGGELTLLAVGESPMAEHFPAYMSEHIMHADLKLDGAVLMASDLALDEAIGHAVSMMIECDSEADVHEKFARLAEGGEVLHPLEHTFWGSTFGDLTDQFGFHWYLNFSHPKSAQPTDYQTNNQFVLS